jgi:hypothetical protein
MIDKSDSELFPASCVTAASEIAKHWLGHLRRSHPHSKPIDKIDSPTLDNPLWGKFLPRPEFQEWSHSLPSRFGLDN